MVSVLVYPRGRGTYITTPGRGGGRWIGVDGGGSEWTEVGSGSGEGTGL